MFQFFCIICVILLLLCTEVEIVQKEKHEKKREQKKRKNKMKRTHASVTCVTVGRDTNGDTKVWEFVKVNLATLKVATNTLFMVSDERALEHLNPMSGSSLIASSSYLK